MPCISLSCLIALARTSSTILNRNGECWQNCLVSGLGRNSFKFSLLRIMLDVSLLCMAFVMLKYIPSMPNLLRAFTNKGCCILSNAFSVSIEMVTCFYLSFLYDELHLLICIHSNIFASQG